MESKPQVVLIGGGHTHVQVLRMQAMRPLPADVTLVVDDPVAVYSGMVPGLVAGQYQPHEVEIDVRPLARRVGVRVVHARAVRVDAQARQVHLQGRPPIAYDIGSLNIGSTVAGLELPGVREHALPTRPIATLVDQVEQRLQQLPDPCDIVVVGAGAGGVELAFCLEARIRSSGRTPRVTLLFSSDRVLPSLHPRVSRKLETEARARGITLRPDTRATQVTAQSVRCGDAELPSDLTVWVVGAAPHDLARDSELPVDERGFVWVDDQLRVNEALFAVGDCAVLRSWPAIPKAGVYAVREGPVLIENLHRLLANRPLKTYDPQRDFFGIFNLGDGTAIGAKWGIPIGGQLAMRWKDHIDRSFMDRFQVLGPEGPNEAFLQGMPPMPEEAMVCGGCAAKVGQTDLSRALARLPSVEHGPDVLLGPDEADDAVAWDEAGRTWVQNVDAFPGFVDDPWLVGLVAAHNANSDLYAKGVQPRWAMASVQVPEDAPAEETLFQVMAGLRHVFDAEGIALLGGHTTVGEKLVVGATVTGSTEQPLWTIDQARPGDTVLLTRPLGTGVLFHADMAGRARGRAVVEALEWMQQGNRIALQLSEVHAVTDVTGFGLAGHAAEIARASKVTITIELATLPVLPQVLALLEAGERSTFHDSNRALLKAFRAEQSGPRLELCFDPQTAGGLLITTANPDVVEAVLPHSWRIGTVGEQAETPLVLR